MNEKQDNLEKTLSFAAFVTASSKNVVTEDFPVSKKYKAKKAKTPFPKDDVDEPEPEEVPPEGSNDEDEEDIDPNRKKKKGLGVPSSDDEAAEEEENIPYEGPDDHPGLKNPDAEEEPKKGLSAVIQNMLNKSHLAAGNMTMTGEPMNRIILNPPLKTEELKKIGIILDLMERIHSVGASGLNFKQNFGKINPFDPIAQNALRKNRVRTDIRNKTLQANKDVINQQTGMKTGTTVAKLKPSSVVVHQKGYINPTKTYQSSKQLNVSPNLRKQRMTGTVNPMTEGVISPDFKSVQGSMGRFHVIEAGKHYFIVKSHDAKGNELNDPSHSDFPHVIATSKNKDFIRKKLTGLAK